MTVKQAGKVTVLPCRLSLMYRPRMTRWLTAAYSFITVIAGIVFLAALAGCSAGTQQQKALPDSDAARHKEAVRPPQADSTALTFADKRGDLRPEFEERSTPSSTEGTSVSAQQPALEFPAASQSKQPVKQQQSSDRSHNLAVLPETISGGTPSSESSSEASSAAEKRTGQTPKRAMSPTELHQAVKVNQLQGASAAQGAAQGPLTDEEHPLVADPTRLQRLHPKYRVWIDPKERTLVMMGQICQNSVPLELFACEKGSKEHESIVSLDTKAYVMHAGLLAIGAENGQPVQFYPEFRPPTGSPIDITVRWIEDGRLRETKAQNWVRNVAGTYDIFTLAVPDAADEEFDVRDQVDAWRQLEEDWVFAGSYFATDETTGRQFYAADREGDLICVSNFSSAVLDVPFQSTSENAALLFACYTERIPAIGTTVTLILKPKHQFQGQKDSREQTHDTKSAAD